MVVEGQPSVLELVKTTETIESLSQLGLLYSGLPKNATPQTEMAAQAKAIVDAIVVTQADESAVEVNEARRANDVSTSHIGKIAIENGVDGNPRGHSSKGGRP